MMPPSTPAPWDEWAEPTPEEFSDWFVQQSHAYRVWWFNSTFERFDIANRCFRERHGYLKHQLEYLRKGGQLNG